MRSRTLAGLFAFSAIVSGPGVKALRWGPRKSAAFVEQEK